MCPLWQHLASVTVQLASWHLSSLISCQLGSAGSSAPGIGRCFWELRTPYNCQHAGWLACFAFLWKLFTWGGCDCMWTNLSPCRVTLRLVIRYGEGLLVVRLLAQIRKWKSASPVNTKSSPALCLQRFDISTLKWAASLVHSVIKPGCCIQGW